jgi:hypothetical protein
LEGGGDMKKDSAVDEKTKEIEAEIIRILTDLRTIRGDDSAHARSRRKALEEAVWRLTMTLQAFESPSQMRVHVALRAVLAGQLRNGAPAQDDHNPPGLAEFLLMLFATRHRADYVVGDLNETFARECKEFGYNRAVRRYWAETLRSLWPLFVRAIGRALKWGVVIAAVRRIGGL